MIKTHIIKFRVSDDQCQRIKNAADRRGYKTLSAYLRKLALDHENSREQWLDGILLDIHRRVVQNEPKD